VPVAGGNSGGGGGDNVDPAGMEMLMCMGFSDKQAKKALRNCDNNVERACDWIMSHMDDPESEEEGTMDVDQTAPSVFENKEPAKSSYKLSSFITHLGAGL